MYLIDPVAADPLCAVVPEGTTKLVSMSHTIFLPELGLISISLISDEISLFWNLKSPLIVYGTSPRGPICTSEHSSNVSNPTALVLYCSVADPFVNGLPDISVGSLPDVAVVPETVTSNTLFLYLT